MASGGMHFPGGTLSAGRGKGSQKRNRDHAGWQKRREEVLMSLAIRLKNRWQRVGRDVEPSAFVWIMQQRELATVSRSLRKNLVERVILRALVLAQGPEA